MAKHLTDFVFVPPKSKRHSEMECGTEPSLLQQFNNRGTCPKKCSAPTSNLQNQSHGSNSSCRVYEGGSYQPSHGKHPTLLSDNSFIVDGIDILF